jgi:hypothetical protein
VRVAPIDTQNDNPIRTDYSPRAWKAIKRAAGDVYDSLGLVAFASACWFVAASLPIVLSFAFAHSEKAALTVILAAVPWTILVTSPMTAGVFHLAAMILKREMPVVADIFSGAKQFAVASWKLASAQLVITVVAVGDVVFFYLQFGHTGNFFFAMAGAVALYALGFWGMMVLYQWPLLVEQKPPTHKLIYRSFLFVADNLSFTTVIFFVIIGLTILCLGPGMALLYMGAASITATTALRELFKKYGLAEIEPEVVEDRGWHIGDYR